MYLKRVRFENVRCFEECCIDFSAPSNDRRSWTVILGDNGTGKTTLLRGIALGASDETRASGLNDELAGSLIREGADKAVIEVEIWDPSRDDVQIITTTILRSSSGEDQVEQDDPGMTWSELFMCGYGAGRRIIGTRSYEKYRSLNAIYSLFNYEAELQNPEIPLFRLTLDNIEVSDLLQRIARILLLPTDAIKVDRSGIRIRGPWGDFVPLGAVGDGYAATLSWVMELIGWAMLFKGPSFGSQISGIVFVDELEQHLHPRWQKRIISLLAEEFPSVQFIATTHSPLLAIGTTDLKDEDCQIILLESEDDKTVTKSGLRPPRDQRVDQVLTSYLFGLLTTRNDVIVRDIARYAALRAQDQIGHEERVELDQLAQKLDRQIGTAETPLEQLVQRAVEKALAELSAEGDENTTWSSKTINFELRRQLQILFGHEKEK